VDGFLDFDFLQRIIVVAISVGVVTALRFHQLERVCQLLGCSALSFDFQQLRFLFANVPTEDVLAKGWLNFYN
jgi:hypothetical protein